MSLPGRLLDAVVRRASSAQARLDELRLVKARPLNPRDNASGLLHSAFNPRWLEELAIEPKLILDIGSCDGGMALFLHAQYPDAAIYTYEADPQRAQIVTKTIGMVDIRVVHAAVCDRDGEVDWHSGGKIFAANGSLLKSSQFPLVPGGKVPAIRLDSKFGGGIDFIHMDIEGAEHLALAGLGKLRPKAMFIETVNRQLWLGAQSCHRLLSQMGYIMAGDFGQDRLYVHHGSLK